jgi:hypothetical protein
VAKHKVKGSRRGLIAGCHSSGSPRVPGKLSSLPSLEGSNLVPTGWSLLLQFGKSIFSFVRNSQSSKMAVPFCFPTKQQRRFPVVHRPLNLAYYQRLGFLIFS